MPITKSAKKAMRQSARRRVRNIQRQKKSRNYIKQFKQAIEQRDYETARTLLPKVYQSLDKNVKTKTIKKNTASRTKSRLTKQLDKSTKK
jgi:small subunit ribosomal protein S20